MNIIKNQVVVYYLLVILWIQIKLLNTLITVISSHLFHSVKNVFVSSDYNCFYPWNFKGATYPKC